MRRQATWAIDRRPSIILSTVKIDILIAVSRNVQLPVRLSRNE
jgi:hypothetical protein